MKKGLLITIILSSIIGLIIWVYLVSTILQTGGGTLTFVDKVFTSFSLIVF